MFLGGFKMKETRTVIRKFDANNNMVYLKDSEKEITRRYNQDNKLIYTNYIDSFSNRTEDVEYDSNKIITTTVVNSVLLDFEKSITKVYDLSTNHVHIEESNGLEINKFYDDNNNLIHEENSKGYSYDYEYDDHNNEICYKFCKDKNLIYQVNSEYTYLEDGSYNVHSKYINKDIEIWESVNSKGDITHYKDSENEYWNIYEDNKIIHRDNKGYISESLYNDNGDIISFKNNKDIEIEYIYEDEYLQ